MKIKSRASREEYKEYEYKDDCAKNFLSLYDSYHVAVLYTHTYTHTHTHTHTAHYIVYT